MTLRPFSLFEWVFGPRKFSYSVSRRSLSPTWRKIVTHCCQIKWYYMICTKMLPTFNIRRKVWQFIINKVILSITEATMAW